MKELLFIIISIMAWTEDFSSSSAYTDWQGDWSTLTINANEQLQSHVDAAAEHVLFRPSTAAIDAQWDFFTRIYGGTSVYNLTRFYILSADSITADGYYVQVGGTNHNVTLYRQAGGKATKVIEAEERTNSVPSTDAYVQVSLTRDAEGSFHLYSRIEGMDDDFVEEGSYWTSYVKASYVALYGKNSAKRGHDLYWDDIAVSGEEQTEKMEQTPAITLTPSTDCISLHEQGHENELRIDYEGPANTYTAHMHVYSADGRLVRTCYQQELLDSHGSLIWNGLNDQGQSVAIGVYVVLLEITSPNVAPIGKRYPIAVLY